LTFRSSFTAALACFAAPLVLTGCDNARHDGPLQISVIGTDQGMSAPVAPIAARVGQLIFAATAQGLVSYDAAGDVVPGLAQRWIVVDDGKSYIFRLRRARWANGERVDARNVRLLLQARLRREAARDPYGSLAAVSEVLAMTGDVIEIRLKSARPDFLLALAQPEMGVASREGGTGPYRATAKGDGTVLLTPVDEDDGEDAGQDERKRRLLRTERASRAIVRFQYGGADLVLGGTLADLPYVTLSDVNRRVVRFDPVQGLFGLALSPRTPMFDDPHVREALSMAIEREAIIAYFEMNRWKIAEQIVPQQLDLPHLPTAPGWSGMTMEDRRNFAAGVITRWRAQHGGKPIELTIGLPPGPGTRLLFLALKLQFKAIGVDVKQVERDADLTLVDEVAPYDSISWYLGRLSCARKVHCSEEAEELLKQSVEAPTMVDRLVLLGQAEPLIAAHNGFIPLATPVRWSLSTSRLNGFEPSPRGDHSLRGLVK